MRRRSIALLAVGSASFGCPGPRAPRDVPLTPVTLSFEPDLGAVRGVAAALDQVTFASASSAAMTTTVVAQRGSARAWAAPLVGDAGPIAASEATVAVALSGTGVLGDVTVRGEPGAALVGLDPRTGRARWQLAIGADEWVVVSSVAPAAGGFVVGGSFAGSLRIADAVVSSGGGADGFVARVTDAGAIVWLRRVGGAGPDAVMGVAARGDRIALAGTFTASADVLGQALPAFDERSPLPDGFVASLDADGRRQWSASFGGPQAESVAGVAIDDRGAVVVAGTVRGVVHVGGADLAAAGLADGVIAWWSPDGAAERAVLVGGAEFDGLRGIAAAGDHVVIGGFFSGSLTLGDRTLIADGGDDAFLAVVDGAGSVTSAFAVTGPGREDIEALAGAPGGFVAGIAYTGAARVEDAVLGRAAAAGEAGALIRRAAP